MFYQTTYCIIFMNAFVSRHFKDLCKLFKYYKFAVVFKSLRFQVEQFFGTDINLKNLLPALIKMFL